MKQDDRTSSSPTPLGFQFPDPAGLMDDIDRLRKAITDYASHQSWRCDHPERYPHEPDCPCGLVGTLKSLGFDPGIAGSYRNG